LRQELWGGAPAGGITLEMDLGGDLDVFLPVHRRLDSVEVELFGAFCAVQSRSAPLHLAGLWRYLESGNEAEPWEDVRRRVRPSGWQLVPWAVLARSLCWRFWELAVAQTELWRGKWGDALLRNWMASETVAQFLERMRWDHRLSEPPDPGLPPLSAATSLPVRSAADVTLLEVRVGLYPMDRRLASATLDWKLDLRSEIHPYLRSGPELGEILRAALALALAVKRGIFRQVARACALVLRILLL